MERAIVFDMDGVLFDTERLCRETWIEIGTREGLKDIETTLLSCIGRNKKDSIKLMKEKYGQEFDVEGFMMEASERNGEKMDQNGIPVKEGALELLEFLTERQFRIGLASSTRKARVEDNLSKTGFDRYFQVLVGGDMVRRGKPDPEIYLTACKELGADPRRTFAVEDSPNGVRSAAAAGMKVILVPDLVEPDAEILSLAATRLDSLLDVIEYLQELEIG